MLLRFRQPEQHASLRGPGRGNVLALHTDSVSSAGAVGLCRAEAGLPQHFPECGRLAPGLVSARALLAVTHFPPRHREGGLQPVSIHFHPGIDGEQLMELAGPSQLCHGRGGPGVGVAVCITSLSHELSVSLLK